MPWTWILVEASGQGVRQAHVGSARWGWRAAALEQATGEAATRFDPLVRTGCSGWRAGVWCRCGASWHSTAAGCGRKRDGPVARWSWPFPGRGGQRPRSPLASGQPRDGAGTAARVNGKVEPCPGVRSTPSPSPGRPTIFLHTASPFPPTARTRWRALPGASPARRRCVTPRTTRPSGGQDAGDLTTRRGRLSGHRRRAGRTPCASCPPRSGPGVPPPARNP